jgi:hypothetical protein
MPSATAARGHGDARNPFKIGASRQTGSEGTIRSSSGSEL